MGLIKYRGDVMFIGQILLLLFTIGYFIYKRAYYLGIVWMMARAIDTSTWPRLYVGLC